MLRSTRIGVHMRLDSSIRVLAAFLALTNSSVSGAQEADAARVAVSHERLSSSRSFGVEASPDTAVAVVATDVHAGPRIAIGAGIGVVAGILYTIAAIRACENQPSTNKDMSGLCALGIVAVGPAAVGGGALVGGFAGWLVARSQR